MFTAIIQIKGTFDHDNLTSILIISTFVMSLCGILKFLVNVRNCVIVTIYIYIYSIMRQNPVYLFSFCKESIIMYDVMILTTQALLYLREFNEFYTNHLVNIR